jgi:hypothetical protein
MSGTLGSYSKLAFFGFLLFFGTLKHSGCYVKRHAKRTTGDLLRQARFGPLGC